MSLIFSKNSDKRIYEKIDSKEIQICFVCLNKICNCGKMDFIEVKEVEEEKFLNIIKEFV